jgi:excisionase family DNA binding protein
VNDPFTSAGQCAILLGRVTDSSFRTQLPAVADVADDPRWQPYLAELAQVEQVRRLVAETDNGAPLTLAQAAEVVGVSRKTMYRRATEDNSPFYKLTERGRWQVERKALLEWVERKAAAAAPSPRSRRRRRSKGKGGGMKALDDE